MSEKDIRYMRQALALAEKGRGRTSPNPMVGCVIVRDNAVAGEGYHARADEAHAEANALASAREAAADATIYVTLEPCAHHGRTPPCTAALVEAQPARVVIAMADPNPHVAGGGAEHLREAGVTVEMGLLEAEAQHQNEAYIKHITTGRPFVIAKCAMTLDGKIATHSGHSRWVTGTAARRRTHELRDTVDAILVGSRTVMIDDPSLTTRLEREDTRDPVRVVLDAGAYLDGGRKVFHVESAAPTWVAASEKRSYPFADDVLLVPKGAGGINMAALMDILGKRGITSLLIEGGGATHASAFEAGIVDKVLFFVAPKIVGGRGALTPVEGTGAETMDAAVRLGGMTATAVGEDLLIEAYVEH